MFTGLIEEIGLVTAISDSGGVRTMTISGSATVDDLAVDDSVAVDGCCQTVVQCKEKVFTVVAVEETLMKTTLGDYAEGQAVNLERALKVGDRLGGHFVQGHVDCVGNVVEVEARQGSWVFWVEYPAHFASLVIPVGSIAINGVSLTAARVETNRCMVSIIPHTYAATTFGTMGVGDRVNIEFDMLGKYLRNFVNV